MTAFGIILILLGCVGLYFGTFMFGDIGVIATYSGLISLVTGGGFLKLAHDGSNEV